jgi:hypothetical protein
MDKASLKCILAHCMKRFATVTAIQCSIYNYTSCVFKERRKRGILYRVYPMVEYMSSWSKICECGMKCSLVLLKFQC